MIKIRVTLPSSSFEVEVSENSFRNALLDSFYSSPDNRSEADRARTKIFNVLLDGVEGDPATWCWINDVEDTEECPAFVYFFLLHADRGASDDIDFIHEKGWVSVFDLKEGRFARSVKASWGEIAPKNCRYLAIRRNERGKPEWRFD